MNCAICDKEISPLEATMLIIGTMKMGMMGPGDVKVQPFPDFQMRMVAHTSCGREFNVVQRKGYYAVRGPMGYPLEFVGI